MIQRPDLVALDPDLPQVAKRFRRREEFLSAANQYTTQHTTEEILEEAALYRIPAGPLLDGSTMTEFEQFVTPLCSCPIPPADFSNPGSVSDLPDIPRGRSPCSRARSR